MKEEEEKSNTSGDKNSKNLVYFKQYTSNACGTIALMHSVANNLDRYDFLLQIQSYSPPQTYDYRMMLNLWAII